MHYTDQDYARLYNTAREGRTPWVIRRLGFCMAVILGIGMGYAVCLLVLSLDKQVPMPTMPVAAPELPLSNPLGRTWVEQSGNDGRGKQMQPQRRHSAAGDLARRGE